MQLILFTTATGVMHHINGGGGAAATWWRSTAYHCMRHAEHFTCKYVWHVTETFEPVSDRASKTTCLLYILIINSTNRTYSRVHVAKTVQRNVPVTATVYRCCQLSSPYTRMTETSGRKTDTASSPCAFFYFNFNFIKHAPPSALPADYNFCDGT
jgi:hypothetical protein